MKYKKILAIAMAISVVSASPAFAAAATGSTRKSPSVAAAEKKVYTYDEVLTKAIANSTDLTLSDLTIDLNEKKATYASDSLGGLVQPQNISQYSQLDSYNELMAINSLGAGNKSERYEKEATKLEVEKAVKGAMSTIITDEAALKVADEALSVYKEEHKVVLLKNRLGMATETEVTAARAKVESYEASVDTTEQELSNAYAILARLMGVSGTDFSIEYHVEYVPYVLNGNLSAYVSKSNSTNPDLQKVRVLLDNSIANKTFTLMNDTTPYGSDSINYDISKSQIALKDAEDLFKSAIEDTYKRIIKIEGDIKSAKSSLETAQTALEVAELNFSLGRGTQLAVDGAKVKVKTIENEIEALKYSHDLEVFSFENPCVLG